MPYQTIWVDYECAYCENVCKPAGAGLAKYGWANFYECPVHGMYYVYSSPLHNKGDVLGPYPPKE